MHPELQGLLDRYDALVAAVEAGQLSVDDAMTTLSAIKVVDGQGGQWSLGPDGQFTRQVPGSSAMPADPYTFIPATLMPPPALVPQPLSAQPIAAPWDVPFDQAPLGPQPGSVFPPAQPAGPDRGWLTRLAAVAPWRNRVFLVVVGCMLVAGLLLVARASTQPPAQAPVPIPSASVVPNSVAQSPDPSQAGPTPDQTPAQALAAALSAGDLVAVAGLSDDRTYPALALLAAQVRGATELGLQVSVEPERSSVVVAVTDAATSLGQWKVSLTRKGAVKAVSGP